MLTISSDGKAYASALRRGAWDPHEEAKEEQQTCETTAQGLETRCNSIQNAWAVALAKDLLTVDITLAR